MVTVTVIIDGVVQYNTRIQQNLIQIPLRQSNRVRQHNRVRQPLIQFPVSNVKTILDIIKLANATKRGGNECIICISELKNEIVVPCCLNAFCKKCLVSALKQKEECPLCRADKCVSG